MKEKSSFANNKPGYLLAVLLLLGACTSETTVETGSGGTPPPTSSSSSGAYDASKIQFVSMNSAANMTVNTTYNVDVDIKNIGSANITSSFCVGVHIAPTATYSGGTDQCVFPTLGSSAKTTVTSINAGVTKTVTVTVRPFSTGNQQVGTLWDGQSAFQSTNAVNVTP